MGKGSGRRPPAISDAELEARWAAAFGPKIDEHEPLFIPGRRATETVASEETPTSEA